MASLAIQKRVKKRDLSTIHEKIHFKKTKSTTINQTQHNTQQSTTFCELTYFSPSSARSSARSKSASTIANLRATYIFCCSYNSIIVSIQPVNSNALMFQTYMLCTQFFHICQLNCVEPTHTNTHRHIVYISDIQLIWLTYCHFNCHTFENLIFLFAYWAQISNN